jgi:hypothetical protein
VPCASGYAPPPGATPASGSGSASPGTAPAGVAEATFASSPSPPVFRPPPTTSPASKSLDAGFGRSSRPRRISSLTNVLPSWVPDSPPWRLDSRRHRPSCGTCPGRDASLVRPEDPRADRCSAGGPIHGARRCSWQAFGPLRSGRSGVAQLRRRRRGTPGVHLPQGPRVERRRRAERRRRHLQPRAEQS